jgi:hypothetical protein
MRLENPIASCEPLVALGSTILQLYHRQDSIQFKGSFEAFWFNYLQNQMMFVCGTSKQGFLPIGGIERRTGLFVRETMADHVMDVHELENPVVQLGRKVGHLSKTRSPKINLSRKSRKSARHYWRCRRKLVFTCSWVFEELLIQCSGTREQRHL